MVVPDAVVDFPVDVTADYVGEEWNIAEGETARAWKFTLRSDLKWQDGTPITAQDYVTSAELLLNPMLRITALTRSTLATWLWRTPKLI